MKKLLIIVLLSKIIFAINTPDTLGIHEIFIYPYETDTNIRQWNEPHQILIRKNAKPKELILFFQGSYGKPGGYKYFKSTILDSQNMIIDLRYPNDWLTFEKCQAVLDEKIFDKFRYEIIYGKSLHPTIKVDTNNSLLNRFNKLIRYLAQNTKLKMDFLLDKENNIDFSKITVCGFSQGAGFALLFGAKFPVKKIVLFAGPVDSNIVMKSVASWITDSIDLGDKTIYGLLNKYDFYFKYTFNCWQWIGGDQYDVISSDADSKKKFEKNFIISYVKHKDSHVGILLDENYELYKSVWEYFFKNNLIKNNK